MNKVILSGNLCQDTQLKYTSNNVAVLSNTIAVKNDYKNAEGNYDAQFINFVAYRNSAEYLSQYASKGTKVLIEGKINNRSYEKEDGTKVYVTEVIADKVEALNSKNATTEQAEPKQETDPFAEFGKTVTIDDDFLE